LASRTLSSLLGLCNLSFARSGDYFGNDLHPSPLLHLWSLAVEVQFYLLQPLLLVRFGFLRKAWGMGSLALLMLAVACLETHHQPQWAFYSLEARAWELFAGCWLATRTSVIAPAQAKSLLHLGFVFLVACLGGAMVKREGLQPASLAVVGGTLMILASAHKAPEGRLRQLLGSRALQAIGLSSYAIYLVHWPLLIMAQAWLPGWTPSGKLSVGALSLLLGLLLHFLLERPVRSLWSKQPWSRPPMRWIALGSLFLLVAAASVVRFKQGWVSSPGGAELLRLVPEARRQPLAVAQWVPLGRAENSPQLLILGDSHAQCLLPALDEQLQQRGLSAKAWVAPATLPLLGCKTSRYSDLFDREAMPEALASPAREILLVSSWTWYLKEDADLHQLDGQKATDPPALISQSLRTTLDTLHKAGKKVTILRPWPIMPKAVAHWMMRHQRWKIPTPPTLLEPSVHEEWHRLSNALLTNAAMEQPVALLDPTEAMTSARGRLMHESGGRPLYSDTSHLTDLGSQRLLQWLLPKMGLTPSAARQGRSADY
jgi:hypothetical protein